MTNDSKLTVAFISSYIPRRCGIATFCSDLISSIHNGAGDVFEPLVVAMTAGTEHAYKDPVKFEVRKNVKNDYLSAADFLNFSHVDLICLQHEYGLFGGPGGRYLNLLLERTNAPVLTTLHTILENPPDDIYQATINIGTLSEKIIVMNERGIAMLRDIYGIDPSKVMLIPHGIPDLPFVDSSYYKHKFSVEGRKTILTFGLLNRNKGVENMLKALPSIVEADPRVLYIVLGATHPEVLRQDGEEYRFELQRIADELGLQDHVLFYNQYVSDEQLHHFLCAADIYVTPYQQRQQLTSGTLAFAVGTGKAVVSTPYWAAEELLSEGRGCLVPFEEPRQLADKIIRILQNENYFSDLRRRAYDYGRNIIWPTIGQKYWTLFTDRHQALTKKTTGETLPLRKIPEPSLVHIRRLTDTTGLLQHARFTLPDRRHGYCTDDNARIIVAMAKYMAQYNDPQALELLSIYLSFLMHAQETDGTFHNFMSYDRQWIEPEPDHDSLGRALWALGTLMGKPVFREMVPILKDYFDRSAVHIPSQSPRGKAYCILGMTEYLRQFSGASEIKRYLSGAADSLLDLYRQCADPSWRWFEEVLCYDNAVLPHGLFLAYRITGEQRYLTAARESCDFLMETTYTGKHFSFIGCRGWYRKGQSRARFDQQPLEAGSTVLMLRDAYEATGNNRYLTLQKEAFDWFLGKNDLHIPVYDFRTRGCYDGLESAGVNLNQGAESMISFLLALLSIVEHVSFDLKTLSAQNPAVHENQPRPIEEKG